MTNFNDAKITSLYVSEPGAIHDIEDDAPNAPRGGPFRITLEMVAGEAVAGDYELLTTCTDLTDCVIVPTLKPAAPLNGAASFQTAPWKHDGLHWVFNESVTVDAPKDAGHVYRLTAALRNKNRQVVSSKQSETFVLV